MAHWIYRDTSKTLYDDTTRRAIDYDISNPNPNPPDRPYTAAENAEADARAVKATEEANRVSVEQALQDALVTLQAILDTQNSVIKADPQTFIKDMARIQKRQIRLQIRRLEGTT
jgi:hypothetical protein